MAQDVRSIVDNVISNIKLETLKKLNLKEIPALKDVIEKRITEAEKVQADIRAKEIVAKGVYEKFLTNEQAKTTSSELKKQSSLDALEEMDPKKTDTTDQAGEKIKKLETFLLFLKDRHDEKMDILTFQPEEVAKKFLNIVERQAIKLSPESLIAALDVAANALIPQIFDESGQSAKMVSPKVYADLILHLLNGIYGRKIPVNTQFLQQQAMNRMVFRADKNVAEAESQSYEKFITDAVGRLNWNDVINATKESRRLQLQALDKFIKPGKELTCKKCEEHLVG